MIGAAAVALACGGSSTPTDGGSDDGAATDGPVTVDAAYGGPPFDAAADAPVDAPMDSLQGAYGGPPPDAGTD